MRIALVHDWLNQMGGAEQVLENLVSLFPESPVYTSMYWAKGMPPAYRQWDIRTSWMDRLPGVKRHQQLYLPLYPLAFESLNLDGYDVVLSNKSGFCHGVITPPETLHVCYCLSPTRYVWRYHDYALREGLGPLARAALAPLLFRLRMWDRLAADRVDRFIAISTEIQRRIFKYYRRDSVVIYPPVDTERFSVAPSHDDYYLSVGRLVPYKRVDLVVQACTQLGLPLKVGGVGRDLPRLQAMAGPTVEFLGYVPDERAERADGALQGISLCRRGGLWDHAGAGDGCRPSGDRLCLWRFAGYGHRGRERHAVPGAKRRVAGRRLVAVRGGAL